MSRKRAIAQTSTATEPKAGTRQTGQRAYTVPTKNDMACKPSYPTEPLETFDTGNCVKAINPEGDALKGDILYPRMMEHFGYTDFQAFLRATPDARMVLVNEYRKKRANYKRAAVLADFYRRDPNTGRYVSDERKRGNR